MSIAAKKKYYHRCCDSESRNSTRKRSNFVKSHSTSGLKRQVVAVLFSSRGGGQAPLDVFENYFIGIITSLLITRFFFSTPEMKARDQTVRNSAGPCFESRFKNRNDFLLCGRRRCHSVKIAENPHKQTNTLLVNTGLGELD